MLQQVYSEWWDIFRFDTFHLGADEIHLGCYNSSEAITGYMEDRGIPRTKHGFLKLVISFMNETTHALKRAIPRGREVNFVVWNSHLTNEQYIDNLDPANFTVHIWSGKREGEVRTIQLACIPTPDFFYFKNVFFSFLFPELRPEEHGGQGLQDDLLQR